MIQSDAHWALATATEENITQSDAVQMTESSPNCICFALLLLVFAFKVPYVSFILIFSTLVCYYL